MQKVRRSNNSREAILDAAQKVAVEKGAGKVSLDSVAKEAGLTKGGVLYNFPSKEALISGMLERLMNTYTPRVAEYSTKLEGQPNPTLQSHFHVTRELEELDHNIPMAILAAAAHNLELLQPLSAEMQRRYTTICNEAGSADEAALLWAAGEGLMLMDILGLLPFDHQKKNQLLETLELKAKGNL
ncbi:MAG: TetR/AcrR family transcriptional regulator [Pseudomonadaceae bacterium]|nr:TetR/AcrR family transcriptional regulator [Pseudomonadaceae bacterium]